MKWFDQLKAALMPGRQTDDQAPEVRRVFQVVQTTAGVPVTADNALKNATVWACVTYLSRTVAQLPWRIYRELPNGQSERARTHPSDFMVHKRPNSEMGSFQFRETMVGWACRHGNAVAEIQRDARGVPVAMWPIHPSRVQFKRDAQSGELVYEVNNGTAGVSYLKPMEVFHLRGFGEGSVGLDVVSYAAESIGWAQATELFGSAFFGNGANPSGFLTFIGRLSPDGKDEVEQELKSRHGGPKKAGGTMILDKGWTFEKSGIAPDNAQFIETRQHQIEEICRWFGVPPHKVMHLLRSTFSNIEHQAIEVVVDSITPWALRLEQEADYKFFGQNRQLFYTKMDLKGLLRGDFKSRQEGLQVMRRNGIINGNEWRSLEELDDIGAAGEKYIVEGNMTTIEALGEKPGSGLAVADEAHVDVGDQQDESPVTRARRQAERAIH